jgi:hypothetical protein
MLAFIGPMVRVSGVSGLSGGLGRQLITAIPSLLDQAGFDQLAQQEPDVIGLHTGSCGDAGRTNGLACIFKDGENCFLLVRATDLACVALNAPKAPFAIGPADRGGLQVGDILIALDQRPVAGADDLIRALGAEAIGHTLDLTIIRNATIEHLSVIPVERR